MSKKKVVKTEDVTPYNERVLKRKNKPVEESTSFTEQNREPVE